MQLRVVLPAILLMGSLPSCTNDPGAQKYVTKPITEDHSSVTDPVARWNAYHLSSYVIEQQMSCFCLGGAVRVYVRENKIIDVVSIENGKSIFDPSRNGYKSVPDLFALSKSINPDSVASLTVEFDEKFGFPKVIYVDVSQQMADEEYGYVTTKIEKLLN